LKQFAWIIVGLLLLQIVYGAFMSGMRAAIEFATWPKMNGQWVPDNLFLDTNPFWKNFLDHKPTIQFVHRNLAYLLVFIIMYFWYRIRSIEASNLFAFARSALPILLFVQIALGITVLITSRTGIPVSWGVIHQLVGLLLFSDFLIIAFHLKSERQLE
jgi:cytochrome c oxidase assembly protein subunit 15